MVRSVAKAGKLSCDMKRGRFLNALHPPQAAPILQTSLPFALDPARRLPGVGPLDVQDWLLVDEVYGAQMALRTKLLRTRRSEVLALTDKGQDAAQEVLDVVLDELARRPEYQVGARVRCPDGRCVPVAPDDPLGTLGELVQEDLCLMVPDAAGAYVLEGAVLCFPASWLLAEKIGKPLIGIHDPVAEYDADLARRVQRLFDAIRAGRPLMRHNMLWYADPSLFQPRASQFQRTKPADGGFLRTERQVMRRLPKTGAVVFAIHTYVLAPEDAGRILGQGQAG